MNKAITLSLVRHLLTALGAWIAARGLADSATIEAVSGGAMALIGFCLFRGDKPKPGQGMSAIIVLAAGLSAAGCSSTPAIVRAMAKDNAAISVKVTTVWANVSIVRLNPASNSPPYTATSDGALSVKP